MRPDCYLFDLDGTLVDSAPDLAGAANHMRELRGLPPVPYELLKVTASSGARGLLKVSFDVDPTDENYQSLTKEFLTYYGEHLADHSHLFAGIRELLNWLSDNSISWGIVTNKHERFAAPLVEKLNIKPDILVCGDTLQERKPSPLPLLYCAEKLGKDISKTIYCGDDIRDIQSANSAGAFSIAAAWGYLGTAVPIADWNADLIMRNPSELIDFEIP